MAKSSESLNVKGYDGLSEKDQLLIQQYNSVHLARLALLDRIRDIGKAAIDGDSASSELQSKMQEDGHDVSEKAVSLFIRHLPDIQTLLEGVRGLVALSIETMSEMVRTKDVLGDVEVALLAQMSEAAQNKVERELVHSDSTQSSNPKRTDCWIKTSRKSKRKK